MHYTTVHIERRAGARDLHFPFLMDPARSRIPSFPFRHLDSQSQTRQFQAALATAGLCMIPCKRRPLFAGHPLNTSRYIHRDGTVGTSREEGRTDREKVDNLLGWGLLSRVSLSGLHFTFTPELPLMIMFNSGKVPAIDDVCRFLMAHTFVLSYSTFTSMAFLLVKLLQFKYRQHYTVNPFDAQVIHNILDQLTMCFPKAFGTSEHEFGATLSGRCLEVC